MRDWAASGSADIVEAYTGWWALAGIDCAMGEEPVDWLKPAASPAQAPVTIFSAASAPAAAPVQRWPAELRAFARQLAEGQAEPERAWGSRTIAPLGETGAPLMIVSDLPDPEDMEADALLSGETGKLFDAMLTAVGLDRSRVYISSLCAARPPGGLWRDEDGSFLSARMRHHIGLVAPRKLLILGDRTAPLLLDAASSVGNGPLRCVNLDAGKVEAGAIAHPRMLLKRPAGKAECWRVMQYLIGDGHW